MMLSIRGAMAIGAVAGALLSGSAATAAADDPPNCTAADLAGVMSGVTAATSAYLFTHPDVNWFFTQLKGQPRDEIRPQVLDYLDQHPYAAADLENIRQPAIDFRNRCGIVAPEMDEAPAG